MLPGNRALFTAVRAVVLLTLCIAFVHADCGAHDCLQGCALAVYEPVCGSDGITYGSSCFACCQGVPKFTPGDCPDHDSRKVLATAEEVQLAVSAAAAAAAAAEAAGEVDATTAAAIAAGMPADFQLAAGPPSSISPKAMTRFAGEGFRFIGIGKVNPNFKVEMPAAKPRRRVSASARIRSIIATRFLLDGTRFQYVAIMQPSNAAGMRSAPEFRPPSLQISAEQDLARAAESAITPASQTPQQSVKIGIYGGIDDRTKVSDTTKPPYHTITDLTMWNYNAASKTWPTAGVCSGAVVAKKHILTAAHCVWQDGGWIAGVIATPAKNAKYNPWGQWWCSSLTAFDGYTKRNDNTYDMAVVTCKDQNKYKWDVGVVGWMGRNWGDEKHSGGRYTAGYPQDKYASGPSNPYADFSVTQWTTSCWLSAADDVTDRVVSHTCDTIPGQSGSPVWDVNSIGDRSIRGVAVRACTGTCTGSNGNQYTPLDRALGDAINKILNA